MKIILNLTSDSNFRRFKTYINCKYLFIYVFFSLFLLLVYLFSIFIHDNFSKVGIASFYEDKFHNRKTASGLTYDKNELTAAHRWIPYGARIKVTNLENDNSVVVVINDRGPFRRFRIIDLSQEAALRLDMLNKGLAKVKIELANF